MRLLSLIENFDVIETITAYHGSTKEFDTFNSVGSGVNFSDFGNEQVDRHGIFFSLSPDFSKSYGKVQAYELNIQNTVNIDVRVEFTDWFVRYVEEVEPDLARDVAYIHNYGPKWELFDDEIGELFSAWVQNKGYDSVQFWEDGAETIVVFDPSLIRPKDNSITESFFSDNADILMPIVKTLMKTAARPLIYKLWKKSPNAVLALAAIKKLHDQGDTNPLLTIDQMSNLDVPIKFLKRLAWDAGLHYIPGVSGPDEKPNLLPMYARESDVDELRTVWHVTGI